MADVQVEHRPEPPPAASTDLKAEAPNGGPMGVVGTEVDAKPPAELQRQRTLSIGGGKEKKKGHRRIVDGKTYIKNTSAESLMRGIQLGIRHSVGSVTPKEKRDLLMRDFEETEELSFPSAGSTKTPAHSESDFSFTAYAPRGFRHFREKFGIKAEDFMLSLCNDPLRELANPGASGSVFYLSHDDAFIVKTVQRKEALFLRKLLPGYYMNLTQNQKTLLPKFFGLYMYSSLGRNIRIVVMNNLLPSKMTFWQKYDLKGSTHGRRASEKELSKRSPTLKDLDFMKLHPSGISLVENIYQALIRTIMRDTLVLESFDIMDYSLLIGIHEMTEEEQNQYYGTSSALPQTVYGSGQNLAGGHIYQYSTLMEQIDPRYSTPDGQLEVGEQANPLGGIVGYTLDGRKVLIFCGVIDILQQYGARKKLEHNFKAVIHDGKTVSVCHPSYYKRRFDNFFRDKVFKVLTDSHLLKDLHAPGTATRNKAFESSDDQMIRRKSLTLISGSDTPDGRASPNKRSLMRQTEASNDVAHSTQAIFQHDSPLDSNSGRGRRATVSHRGSNATPVTFDRSPLTSTNSSRIGTGVHTADEDSLGGRRTSDTAVVSGVVASTVTGTAVVGIAAVSLSRTGGADRAIDSPGVVSATPEDEHDASQDGPGPSGEAEHKPEESMDGLAGALGKPHGRSRENLFDSSGSIGATDRQVSLRALRSQQGSSSSVLSSHDLEGVRNASVRGRRTEPMPKDSTAGQTQTSATPATSGPVEEAAGANPAPMANGTRNPHRGASADSGSANTLGVGSNGNASSTTASVEKRRSMAGALYRPLSAKKKAERMQQNATVAQANNTAVSGGGAAAATPNSPKPESHAPPSAATLAMGSNTSLSKKVRLHEHAVQS
eukprot:Clim_evm9s44 gene=Clim_evmTU9s44